MVEFGLLDVIRNLALALRWTLALSMAAFIGGGLLGTLLLVGRVLGPAGVRGTVAAYVGLFQGTPLLIQLFLAYFGPAAAGLDVSAWSAACLALTLYTAAYLAEIWRGCVAAIPRGQWDAAASLGLPTIAQLRFVVVPLALRMAVPPTVGFAVQVVKGTALASIIGFVELTKAGTMIANATFEPFLVYSCVALAYFGVCFPISLWSRQLEKRWSWGH